MPSFEGPPNSNISKKVDLSIEELRAGLDSSIKNIIGHRTVELQNETQFLLDDSRFLYAFTKEEGSAGQGFLKAAKMGAARNHEQLKRESAVMDIANTLGIPSVKQIQPYQESGGYGVVHFEKLTAEDGELLATPELIATANPEYGAWGGEALLKASGVLVPENTDTGIFKKNDERNESPEKFWSTFDSSVSRTLDLSPDKQALLNPTQIEHIKNEIGFLRPLLDDFIQNATDPTNNYFVHNDAAPNNTFFNTKTNEATLLDFEHAGITHNPVLAKLTDFGNFYARAWANPEMQTSFISALIKGKTGDDLDKAYILAKGTILFGSVFLAKYGMEPSHGEHKMSKMLLGSLSLQLERLDKNYLDNKNR